jgi:hypothetical protein
MLRSGNAASFLVEFPSGAPDGNLSWTLLGPDGTLLTSGSINTPDNAVSEQIVVPGQYNTLPAGELTSYRDLTWTYSKGGAIINGEERYTLQGRVPYGATPQGVRNKLGVDPHDLPDDEIDLVKAYYDYGVLVARTAFPDVITVPQQDIRIRDAIEALAALVLVPSMQVRIASKESSGTDTFQRQKIDWALLADNLNAIVVGGALILDPAFDETAGFGAVFILASPTTDAITAEGAVG